MTWMVVSALALIILASAIYFALWVMCRVTTGNVQGYIWIPIMLVGTWAGILAIFMLHEIIFMIDMDLAYPVFISCLVCYAIFLIVFTIYLELCSIKQISERARLRRIVDQMVSTDPEYMPTDSEIANVCAAILDQGQGHLTNMSAVRNQAIRKLHIEKCNKLLNNPKFVARKLHEIRLKSKQTRGRHEAL